MNLLNRADQLGLALARPIRRWRMRRRKEEMQRICAKAHKSIAAAMMENPRYLAILECATWGDNIAYDDVTGRELKV